MTATSYVFSDPTYRYMLKCKQRTCTEQGSAFVVCKGAIRRRYAIRMRQTYTTLGDVPVVVAVYCEGGNSNVETPAEMRATFSSNSRMVFTFSGIKEISKNIFLEKKHT